MSPCIAAEPARTGEPTSAEPAWTGEATHAEPASTGEPTGTQCQPAKDYCFSLSVLPPVRHLIHAVWECAFDLLCLK